jgi:hypothetical protein
MKKTSQNHITRKSCKSYFSCHFHGTIELTTDAAPYLHYKSVKKGRSSKARNVIILRAFYSALVSLHTERRLQMGDILRGCLVQGHRLGDEDIPNQLVRDNHIFCLVG